MKRLKVKHQPTFFELLDTMDRLNQVGLDYSAWMYKYTGRQSVHVSRWRSPVWG